MASSHAFTLLDPEKWDEVRERNRAGYKRRYGVEPPVQPKVAEESPEENRVRHANASSQGLTICGKSSPKKNSTP